MFIFTIRTLLVTVLLNIFQSVKPMKIKMEKLSILRGMITPNTSVYTSMKHTGSKIHHNQFRCEPATSAFSCERAEYLA